MYVLYDVKALNELRSVPNGVAGAAGDVRDHDLGQMSFRFLNYKQSSRVTHRSDSSVSYASGALAS